MADHKSEAHAAVQHRDSESQQEDGLSEKKGTAGDQKDMYRMGKQQELRRDFRALSALAFTVILQGR